MLIRVFSLFFPIFCWFCLFRLLNIPTRAQESEFITAARPPCLYTCICYYSRVAMGSIDYFKSIPQVLKHTHTLLHVQQYTTYINYRKNSIKTAGLVKLASLIWKPRKLVFVFPLQKIPHYKSTMVNFLKCSTANWYDESWLTEAFTGKCCKEGMIFYS